ncbi:mCG146942 [Mus musculus]|nr:mCG146942 [Mus musculus]
MSGKGSLLDKPSWASRYLISMENSVLGLYDHRAVSFMLEAWLVFQVRSLAGSWKSSKPQVCAHQVSGSRPALPYQTSWHGFTSHMFPGRVFSF